MQLASLPEGKFEQDFKCDTEFFKNMENPDIMNADVDVHLEGEKKNDRYDCNFICNGKLTIPCDRCLDPIDIDIDTAYHITVEFGDEYNDASEDLLVIPYSDRYLNVAYMLYDTIALQIPLRHVHPQGKCNRAMLQVLSKHRAAADIDEEGDDSDPETEGED